jgi:hypothetical protein
MGKHPSTVEKGGHNSGRNGGLNSGRNDGRNGCTKPPKKGTNHLKSTGQETSDLRPRKHGEHARANTSATDADMGTSAGVVSTPSSGASGLVGVDGASPLSSELLLPPPLFDNRLPPPLPVPSVLACVSVTFTLPLTLALPPPMLPPLPRDAEPTARY